MRISLVHIGDVKPEWETAHRVRALEVDGRTPALADLAMLKRKHRSDYDRLIEIVRAVAGERRIANENRVKRGRVCREIYEMRGGQARLLFFYAPVHDEVVVCTNVYWKAKPSEVEQNAAFARAERLRQIYLTSARPRPA
jgi:hypothetical protein